VIRSDFGLCGSSVLCSSCLNIPVYTVVCAQTLENLLHRMRESKTLWVTVAAHKPCNAWGKNDRSDLRCQIASLWHELLIRLTWALTLLICNLEATGLDLRHDINWSSWIFVILLSVSRWIPWNISWQLYTMFLPITF